MNSSSLEKTDAHWRSLYTLAGLAAGAAVLVGVVEMFLTFLPDGNPTGLVTAADWYALFQRDWFFGLRNLGLMNIFLTTLGILVTFALYGAHRHVSPTYAALLLGISFMGDAVFFATNRAFAMWDLSQHYLAATAEGQRLALVAAGQALLAVGLSHSPGTFLAFFLSESSGVGMSLVMWRGRVFNRAGAAAGGVGFGLLLVYEVCIAFIPAAKPLALGIAMLGGLATLVWYVGVAGRLFQLGRGA